MKRRDPDLEALIERGRVIRRAPDLVRARALARARATMAAEHVLTPDGAPELQARGRKVRVALAAALCLAVGGTVAVAALRSRVEPRHESAPPLRTPVVPPPRIATPTMRFGLSSVPLQPITIGKSRRSPRPINRGDSYAAELQLLQRAQAAYARRDLRGALVLIAEHAERFPTGCLAEEREALRALSLAGSGRTEEARHAVAVFAERFPRSVLIPRLAASVRTPE